MTMDEPKKAILQNTQKALDLLTEADNRASDLINSNLLDFHQSSALTTYFYRVLVPMRELTEYLEKELTWSKQ